MTDRRVLLIAMAIAAAVRIDLLARRVTISVDGVQYVAAARQFAMGAWAKGLASFYPPGYPAAIAAVAPLTGDFERAGLLVSAAAGVAALWPLAGLTRRAGLSSLAGAATLVGFALAPYPARYAATVRSEALYGLLLLLAVWWTAVAREDHRTVAAVAAGVAVGGAYLVRPEGLFLLLPLAAVLRRPRQVVALTLALGLLALPYVLYLHQDTGRWLLSRKASNVLSLGIHEAVGEGAVVSQHESATVPVLDVLRDERGLLGRKLARDAVRTFAAFGECVHFVYLPFVLAGLWQLGWPRRTVWQLAHAVTWFYVAFFALVYVDRRFYNGIVPLALLWGGVGTAAAARALVGRPRWQTILAAGTLGAAILGKTLWVTDASGWVRQAGAAIRQLGGAGQAIVARDLRVSYYAGGRPIEARFPLDDEQLRTLLAGPARWLVAADGDLTPDARELTGTSGRIVPAASIRSADGRAVIRVLRLQPVP